MFPLVVDFQRLLEGVKSELTRKMALMIESTNHRSKTSVNRDPVCSLACQCYVMCRISELLFLVILAWTMMLVVWCVVIS